ncbi:hypothetical protein MsAg5_16610 [Methanosarcinaceae archaeon Ag5]|uniref:Transposase n=1 Tax=Methanolapillus africanus TaxID=3028297 RepID=A0AAE4MLB0_9EURY|nr:hypothetical protein [Methanosarcinaceae archaeon Ag5]
MMQIGTKKQLYFWKQQVQPESKKQIRWIQLAIRICRYNLFLETGSDDMVQKSKKFLDFYSKTVSINVFLNKTIGEIKTRIRRLNILFRFKKVLKKHVVSFRFSSTLQVRKKRLS